jgi:glycosyltransferase involved in cell wall biosynthesis
LRIAVISTYGIYPELNNGPPIVIYSLINEWLKSGNSIYLFIGTHDRDKLLNFYQNFDNLRIYPFQKAWSEHSKDKDHKKYVSSLRTAIIISLKMPMSLFKISKELFDIKPDIIFYNLLPFDNFVALPFIVRSLKFPQIARVPVYWPYEFEEKSSNILLNILIHFVYRLSLRSLNLIITQSQEVKDIIIKNLNSNTRCLMIPNGTFLSSLIRNFDNEDRNIIILFTGNISKNKGIEVLIDSMGYLKENIIKRLKILLIGRGYDDYLTYITKLIKERNLDDKILLIGSVNHDNINYYYQKADIFIFPSYREGMSLSLLEAMGEGLPIIASNISSINNLIVNEVNGLLFKPGKSEDLASCIERLVIDKKLREKLSLNSMNTARNFEWQKIAQLYLRVFEDKIS